MKPSLARAQRTISEYVFYRARLNSSPIPCGLVAPLGVRAYCTTESAVPTGKLLIAGSVTDIEARPLLWAAFSRFAVRPPQPLEKGLSGTELCH
ncbi:MAG: hypothetical protein M2R45_03958 [Verrucomicrobia subdivision 3 bacterium]|nr:hypothetical protein [Limisphaerales bacterium]MCS1415522.1 hypothetical protein [Limisphaerales bacterium]